MLTVAPYFKPSARATLAPALLAVALVTTASAADPVPSQATVTEVHKGKGRALPARAPALAAVTKSVVPFAPVGKDAPAAVAEIELYAGESRVFPAPGVARIAVGNGQVLSASAIEDKEVIIFGGTVGSTSLFIWHEDGRHQQVKVNVVPGDTARVAREIAAFLTMIPNASAAVVGDKVIVEGDDLADADRDKVAELAKRYPQIVNFTSPIGWEKMVMMDVKVVEFPRSELRELGLKWNPTGGAAFGAIWSPLRLGHNGPYQINVPGSAPISNAATADGASTGTVTPSALNALAALNLGLAATLSALEQNGSATILAEPQLSTRSGYKASFLAGGEFPYSAASIAGVTVQYKPYGIKLDIEPRVGNNGVIRAVIDSEVSSIDASVTTASGPALLTRKTRTEFNVRDGETIVLSGLLQRNTNQDIDKVPLLGDIPVLGALFRSKRFQNKETELVVFVTPTVVDSAAPSHLERVERAQQKLAARLGRQPFLSDPLQPNRDMARPNQGGPASAARPAVAALGMPAVAGMMPSHSGPVAAPSNLPSPGQPPAAAMRAPSAGLSVAVPAPALPARAPAAAPPLHVAASGMAGTAAPDKGASGAAAAAAARAALVAPYPVPAADMPPELAAAAKPRTLAAPGTPARVPTPAMLPERSAGMPPVLLPTGVAPVPLAGRAAVPAPDVAPAMPAEQWWDIAKGQKLSAALGEWGRRANVEIAWDGPDYRAGDAVRLYGSFDSALLKLLEGANRDGVLIRAKDYQGDGKRTIRIVEKP